MSRLDATGGRIFASVALEQAVRYAQGRELTPEQVLELALRFQTHLLQNRDLGVDEVSFAPEPAAMTAATANVMAGFPGSQVVPQAPNVIPFGAAQGQPFAAPAPQETEEALWRDALTNGDGWYNNVGSDKAVSGGGKGPDFKRKADGKGLWLVSRGEKNGKSWAKRAPDWVFAQLGFAPPPDIPAPAPGA